MIILYNGKIKTVLKLYSDINIFGDLVLIVIF